MENKYTRRGFTQKVVNKNCHPERDSGSRRFSNGFTLIELLVVVLIIGILAAIALPQYNKAVAKTRLSEQVQFIGDMQRTIDIYILENGITDTDFQTHPDLLSVDLQATINKFCTEEYSCTFGCDATDNVCVIQMTANVNYDIMPDLMTDREINGTWNQSCQAGPSYPRALSLCDSLNKLGWK